MTITERQIKAFAPNAKPALVAAIIDGWPAAERAGIAKNTKRLHGFMASIAVETQGLLRVEENLNYTTPARLRQIFGKYIKSEAAAKGYVRQPKKLAILVYGGRLGNAPGPSTDGWDYRGGGMMQTTGRDNYRDVGFESNPDALRGPATAFATAVKEWVKRKCNTIADSGDLKALQRSINGGLNGYEEFVDWVERARRAWPSVPTSAAPLVGRYDPVPADDVDNVDTVEDKPEAEERKIHTDEISVARVQGLLKAAGYTEVGEVDGKMGKFTRTAILAFRNENDLPVTPDVDDELLIALGKAKPRNISPERAEATKTEVGQKAPEVQTNGFNKVIAAGVVAVTGTGSLVTGTLEAVPQAKGMLEPLKDMLGTVPPWLWLFLALVVAGAIFLLAQKGEKAGVEAYRAGERR